MVKVSMLLWFLVALHWRFALANSVDEDKRSLVIVFDTTASMRPHLDQLKKAAISIIREFSTSGKNRIFNYVFSPFNDPTVGPRTITTDANKFMRDISNIEIYSRNNRECPELPLSGMIAGLTGDVVRMPIVFVITDAAARDGDRYNELTKLIESTQAQINFIRTYSCGPRDNTIYQKIADYSGGLFFDMKVQNINNVLQVLKRTLEKGQINIYHINYNHGGKHEIPIYVDDTLNKLIVTLTGTNPSIILKDPNHHVVHNLINALHMHNIKSIEVNDPITGKYTLVSSSSSKHDIKIEGQSSLAMSYGFSLTQPDSATNSSFVPVQDHPNVLSVAVTSGANLIKTLTKAVLKSRNKEINVPLNYKSNGNFYTSNLFVPPNESFKIIVYGLDKDGNIFQRIVSTNVVPTRNFPPILLMKEDRKDKTFVGDSYSVVCEVTSFTSASIQWKKGNHVIQSTTLSSGAKNHKLILKFDSIQLIDAGEYLCTATNGYGTKYLSTKIVVNQVPVLTVSPKTIKITEGSKVQIKCNVKNIDSTAVVYWKFNNLQIPNSKISADHTLTLSNINRNEKGSYVCGFDYDRFHKTDSASVSVFYGPSFNSLKTSASNLLNRFGTTVSIDCSATGFPAPEITWTHRAFDKGAKSRNINSGSTLTFTKFKPADEGIYTCRASNEVRQITHEFTVHGIAGEKPKILVPKNTTLYVESQNQLDLPCICRGCKPIKSFKWTAPHGYEYSEAKTEIKHDLQSSRVDLLTNDQANNFNFNLKLLKAYSNTEGGKYVCEVENDFGKDSLTLTVVVNEDYYDTG